MEEIRIFISHKKEDSDKAKAVYEYIKNNWEFDAYLDEFDKNINRHNVVERIVKNLRDSTHLLVIFSEHTINSMWVPFELGVSYEREQGIGVLIWPDGMNINYKLPEYLDEFPKLSCHKKYYSDKCYTNDLDKYLEEIKEIPNKIVLEDSLGYGAEEFGFTKRASEINYSAEFIRRLKEKLGQ